MQKQSEPTIISSFDILLIWTFSKYFEQQLYFLCSQLIYKMDLQQQQSPLSSTPLQSKPYQNFTVPNTINFVKSLRRGFNSNDKIICIYEEKPFTVQIKSINQFTNLKQYEDTVQINSSQHQQFSKIYDISQINEGEIRFQSVPYDCIEFSENLWLISTKAMPPRVYKRSSEFSDFHINHIASFTNKKKNSQQYLSPLQFGMFKNNSTIVGGGIRFLSTYDIEKCSQNLFPIFNKVNISCVGRINENSTIFGTFNGGITIFDLRDSSYSQKDEVNFQRSIQRPHVEAVMNISTTEHNQYIFSSSARMDNFTYIFDTRNYPNNYICRFQEERNSNQRISNNFSSDGKTLFCGSENSSILEWNYEKEQVTRYKFSGRQTINSVIEVGHGNQNYLVFATGHRVFENMDEGQSSDQQIQCKRYNAQERISNKVGAVKVKPEFLKRNY